MPQVPQTESPILNYIRQKYVPASADTATLRMSTAEICEAISAHTGSAAYPDQTYQWLVDNGYSQDDIGNMRFEWMLKEAE